MKSMLVVLYAIIIIFFVFFSYLFIDPNFIYYKSIFTDIAYTQRLLTSVIYTFLVGVMFVIYGYVLYKLTKKEIDLKDVCILITISSLLLASYPAIISYDIFNYLATAKVTFFYFENPYLVMPIEFVGDSILLYTRAANKFALYGPGWIGLTGIPYYLSFSNVILQLFLFKIFVSLFYAGTVYLLYKISKNVFIVSFFALNPLVIIETFMSGHNDIVMMFFVFLGFYLFIKEKRLLASASLLYSVFIKFATIFLAPVWGYMLYKNFKKEKIDFGKIWKLSLVCMTVVLLLSPLREEMYPWYFIWVLPFVALLNNKKLQVLTACMSVGFLASYIPYMYTGYYYIILKVLFFVAFTVFSYVTLKVMQKIIKVL